MARTGIRRLAGERAIVTGAGSDIGPASVRLFAHERAAVLVADIAGVATDVAAAAINRDGGRTRPMRAGIGSGADVRACVAVGVEEFGRLNVLCANPGPVPYSASRTGIISFVRRAAHKLYGTGIRVSAICPDLIETATTRPLFEHAYAGGSRSETGRLNPPALAGAPEEIGASRSFSRATSPAMSLAGHSPPMAD
jgi:NAD(P)-dependent dehydrogenase (short-subunit alcohol dehydrogenase family)